jgi:hypothetical protein
MLRLNREAFERARMFLKTQARPLDRAVFGYRFEGSPAEVVIAELAHYQNGDGGFGRALEPDLRTPTSSALATGIGLRVLKELNCPADDAMVKQSVQFLLETVDQEKKVWRVAPHDTNKFPHAPWWHDEAGSLARTFDDFQIIPRAEIVGLLHHFSDLVPGDWLDDLTQRTVACIETIEALGTGGGDDLAYALSLAGTEVLPYALKRRLLSRIRGVVPSAVSRNPKEWGSYCISPLKIAPSPQSPVADLLWDDLQAHLDYQIDHQTPEGTWDPVWSWGDFYPDVWEEAKLEWRGHLTLETLTALHAFGRIEAQAEPR